MLENVLRRYNLKVKITVKSVISLGLTLAAAFLPLLVHASIGTVGGATWLPMYLPVLLGGCLLGGFYGVAIGIASPIASYLISLAILGLPMPIAEKLPYMIMELSVFGIVSGLFAKSISKKPLLAFPAVICAQCAGRVINLILNIFMGQASLGLAVIQKGLPGLYAQVIIVPLIIIALAKSIKYDKD